MFKFSEKFSFLSTFCCLYFLYNFCSILCFCVEDHFDAYVRPFFVFGDDYWSAVGKMFCCGVFAIFFQKSGTVKFLHTNILSQIMCLFFIFVVIVHISQIIGNYFNVSETSSDRWILGINILAIIIYASILYISETIENVKKRTYILIGIFGACFATACAMASHYMPRSVLKTLSQDKETLLSVRKAVNALKAGLEIPSGLSNNVKVRDENGKRIITYQFETDFEGLKEKSKFTKRLRKRFNFTPDLFKEGEQVGTVLFKKGTHILDVPLPKTTYSPSKNFSHPQVR